MAPRKRKTVDGEEVKASTVTTTRVTRSSSRGANSKPAELPPAELPKKKKGKVKAEKKGKEAAGVETEAETEAKTENEGGDVETEAGREAKTEDEADAAQTEMEAETDKEEVTEEMEEKKEVRDVKAAVEVSKKTVVIEHCKQCNSFKTRALQVKSGLEKAIPGISVVINPDKPRRGCLEIREEGGETFISLLDMKRPFQPMKALDMEKVISDIIDKIK